MYFKRLELLGFKSFANKTTLDFEPGITAVVGPNGCGKSNIFDAIRWVLGEQSVKSLRGSQMCDVIFNGTEIEAGVGFAEVSLIFDNSNKNLNIVYEEVIITRRLYRSGESEYLINKSPVRLKDILTLFMGTGIGAESYSFVGQGKIDLIVSIKPEERRYIIDEAAGITRYKSKKKETLRKLEETENNILRVNDIVSEVKRQIASIERQANKAQRYKEQFEQLKNLETQLAYYKLDVFDKEKKEKETEAGLLSLQEQKLKDDLAAKLLNIEALKKDLIILQNELQESKTKLFEAKKKQEINNENIKLNNERIEDYNKLLADVQEKKEELIKRIQAEEENIKIFYNEAAVLENKFKEANIQVSAIQITVQQNEALIKTLQQDVIKAKNEIFKDTSDLTKIKNEITDCSGQLMSWQARKRRLDMELAKTKQEKSVVYEQFIGAKDDYIKAESEVSSFKKEIDSLTASILQKKNELNGYNKKISDLESELLTLKSQKEFLQDLKLRYDNLPDAAKGIIFTQHEALTECGLLGRILQTQEIVSTEKDLVGSQYNSKFIVEIKPLDLDAKNISRRIEELQLNISDISAKRDRVNMSIQSDEEISAGKEKELHQKEISLSNIGLKKTDFENQLTRFDDELSLLESELQEANKEICNFEKKLNDFKAQLFHSEQQVDSLEKNIEENQRKIVEINTVREQDVIVLTKLKAEISALEEARNNQLQTRKLLEETKNRHIVDKNSLIVQSGDLQKKLENAQIEINKYELENTNIADCVITLEKDLEVEQLSFSETSKSVKNIEEENSQINELLETNNSTLFNLRLAVQEIDFKKKSILERMQQLYQMQDMDFSKKDGVSLTVIDLEKIRGIETEVENSKKRIESYGTVNLVAVQEHEELKARLEFLTTQANDLTQAKESLEKAIRKINQTSRKMFLETFSSVNEEFKNYFRTLFGGGQAELFLVDEQDPLESGIEIVCRPPGKKMQNISLLSGGEKSLAASALMFAIFKVKPAPFCILDEVDGALDEANIDRFRKLLEEFSKISQFIVITHNKKTISSSDVMYGITMEQTGISKIVSVRFAKEPTNKIPSNEEELLAANS